MMGKSVSENSCWKKKAREKKDLKKERKKKKKEKERKRKKERKKEKSLCGFTQPTCLLADENISSSHCYDKQRNKQPKQMLLNDFLSEKYFFAFFHRYQKCIPSQRWKVEPFFLQSYAAILSSFFFLFPLSSFFFLFPHSSFLFPLFFFPLSLYTFSSLPHFLSLSR